MRSLARFEERLEASRTRFGVTKGQVEQPERPVGDRAPDTRAGGQRGGDAGVRDATRLLSVAPVRREQRRGAEQVCVDGPLSCMQCDVEPFLDERISQIPVPGAELDL